MGGGGGVAANYNETTMSDDDNGSLTSRLNDDLRRGPSSFLGRARGGEGGWNVEPDRVGSRAIAKSWECLGQGSPCFSFVASLSFIPLLSLCLSLSVFEGEESGATRHESCKLGGEKGRFFGLVKSLKSVRGRAG